MRATTRKSWFIPIVGLTLVIFAVATGCAKPSPIRTVQNYMQLLSGERPVTQASLEAVTTEKYRSAEHPHLLTIASEKRSRAIDLADELREDPAIRELLKKVSWKTKYDVIERSSSSARVVARVIMIERHPGDREAALKIPNLPQPLVDVLQRGLELPFQFELKMESGIWKIDSFEFPKDLVPLLEIPAAGTREE